MNKKDYFYAALAGFITGIFAIPIFANLNVDIPYRAVVLLFGVPLLWMFGIWLGKFLVRWLPFMYQFAKFSVTGFLSTAIDFGILNFLILVSGSAAGIVFSVFKTISFIVANINSYLWNKFWTFKKPRDATESKSEEDAAAAKEYVKFLLVSLIGLLINVGVASLVVNVVGPQFGIGQTGWANIGAVAGSASALIWNFVGYKLIVFKV